MKSIKSPQRLIGRLGYVILLTFILHSHCSQHLTADKEKVLKELQEREEMTSQLTQEKRHLSETTEELRQHLMEIEQQTLKVKQETEQAKEKLVLMGGEVDVGQGEKW